MVFNTDTVLFVILAVIAIWNVIITFVLFRTVRHYNRLTGTTFKNTLKEVLEAILDAQKVSREEQKKLEKHIEIIEHEAKFHIQRVGLVRFNPFSDTGGSQSFTLALLDGSENGIVMTSLYARTGNRWYVKHVKNGKGVGLELSKEEQAAIVKAKQLTEGTS